jgi:hypothetical protein
MKNRLAHRANSIRAIRCIKSTVLALILSAISVVSANALDLKINRSSDSPTSLHLLLDGVAVKEFQFSANDKRATIYFPSGYSNAAIRVFKDSELTTKENLLATYSMSTSKGVMLFDRLWSGATTSGGELKCPESIGEAGSGAVTVCKNPVDATFTKVNHFILKFEYQGTQYLFDPQQSELEHTDPQIRNRTR